MRDTQRGYSLYRGTHFKDNEGFEANWMQCEAFRRNFAFPAPSPDETKP